MAGLPRSGNTLISCILNQNPKIKVSANSLVSEIFYNLEVLKNNNIYQNFPDEKSLENVISNIFDSYYRHWECEYIIDRSVWGTPDNLFLLQKYLKNDIKIISPVRDLLHVISSMYDQQNDILNNIINSWSSSGWRMPCDKTLEEVKCEILMEKDSMIEKSLLSVKNLSSKQNKKFTKFIEYDDLVENTEKEIKKIYEFLDIEYYNHDYTNLKQYEVNGIKYNDYVVGQKNNMHYIKSQITKSKTDLKKFNQKIISRYSNLECWRE